MATKREWDRVINHWTRAANGKLRKNEDVGSEDCAFCKRYLTDDETCFGCPIFIKTGQAYCENTPYDDVFGAGSLHGLHSKEFLGAAAVFLEWLKKLRKEVRGD